MDAAEATTTGVVAVVFAAAPARVRVCVLNNSLHLNVPLNPIPLARAT